MTLCKFFLQGTCRFGDSCKFEHAMPRTDHGYTNPQSILLQNNKSGSGVDTAQIVKAVINDMVSAERGGQWLLSSYAPYKDKGPFPGFEDFSMEEIRWLFYQARASNTVEQYKQQVQGSLQQAMMKIRALQNPSPEIVNMLRGIYNATPANNVQQQQQQQPFAEQQPGISSIFGGGVNQQKSIFGSPPAATAVAPGQSIFGGGAAASPQNIFGNPSNTPSVFGGATPSNPPDFGGATNASASIFGGSPQVGSSIFGGGATASNSIFGGGGGGGAAPQSSTGSSIFGAGPSAPNPFGAAVQQQQPTFASPLQSAQPVATNFGDAAFNIMQQNARGGFFPPPQAPENSQQAFQHSSNIFGNLVQQQQQQQQQQQLMPQQQQQQQQQQQLLPQQQQMLHQQQQQGVLQQQNMHGDDPFVHLSDDNYSKPEDLTADEIEWYKNDNLDMDLGKIPINPPSREMCL